MFTETERERLWIHKLDKQERWICGEKIDISKGEEEYYKVLQHHRERSKLLGYGDGNRDWNRKKYEEERRIIIQNTKIKPPAGY